MINIRELHEDLVRIEKFAPGLTHVLAEFEEATKRRFSSSELFGENSRSGPCTGINTPLVTGSLESKAVIVISDGKIEILRCALIRNTTHPGHDYLGIFEGHLGQTFTGTNRIEELRQHLTEFFVYQGMLTDQQADRFRHTPYRADQPLADFIATRDLICRDTRAILLEDLAHRFHMRKMTRPSFLAKQEALRRNPCAGDIALTSGGHAIWGSGALCKPAPR